jgi:competence protein ComEC
LKNLKDHALLLAVTALLAVRAGERLPLLAMVLAAGFVYFRTRDGAWKWTLVLVFLALLPRTSPAYPAFHQGRVVQVSAHSVRVRNAFQVIQVSYDGDMPLLDSTVSFSGKPVRLTSQNGFYRFDFARYAAAQGIYYQVYASKLTTLQESQSLRGAMQEKILRMEDETRRDIFLRLLLGIRSDQQLFASVLQDTGFTLSGIVVFLRLLLQHFFRPRTVQRLEAGITLGLGMLYHFPLLLTVRLVYAVLSLGGMEGRQRTGIGILICLVLMPSCVWRTAFLIPSIFRLCFHFFTERRSSAFFFSLFLQALFWQRANPLETLLFRFLMPLKGFCWLVGAAGLFLPLPVESLLFLLDKILAMVDKAALYGSPYGWGLPFFLVLGFQQYRKKHVFLRLSGLLLMFLSMGLFHPFAQIVTINVGQGTSVLFRAPLGRGSVLLDTGRPAAYETVETMLRAKGMRRLDALIVSHGDSDHAGNAQTLCSHFEVRAFIHAHQDQIQAGGWTFYDLNKIANGDENESSLVLYTTCGGLSFLFPGDVDAYGERQIVRRFDKLRVDVLTLSHHGSSTGTSRELLDQVQPQLAWISSGSYQLYHHPSKEVVQRLLKRRIPYFDTKTEGDFSLTFLPFGNVFFTSSGTLLFLPGGPLPFLDIINK